MANSYKLQVRKSVLAKVREEFGDRMDQPWYPRIVAGNGKVVFTGEMMHNRSDAGAALAKLVMAIQSHEFKYEFPDG